MNHLIRMFGCAALLVLPAGCGNDFNKEIERWNGQFAAYQNSCLSGNLESCRLACQMSRVKSVCESARRFVDPDNPAQVQWLAACPQSIAAQGAPLCQRAESTITAPVLATPEAATPEVASPVESPPDGYEAPAQQGIAPRDRSAAIHVRSGVIQVKGSLSKEVVRRIVHRHINEVKLCYERGLASKPDLSGRLLIKFIISGTGNVQMSALDASTLGDSGVENCIVQAARRWTFPQPAGGGIVIVTYPFMLGTSG